MTDGEARDYLRRMEKVIFYNVLTPIKGVACILHIVRQIRDTERIEYMGEEEALIEKLFFQEERKEP